MMKKPLVIVCVLVLSTLLFTSNSLAIDFGMYFDIGIGSGEAEYDLPGTEEFDIDTDFLGIGFQFETNPLSAKKSFSYRFQAGFESRDIEDESGDNLELLGFLINNTFSFGGNPSENIRLWGGPQILIGIHGGEVHGNYIGEEVSFTGAALGIGIAGGANIGLGSGNTILTTTIGLRRMRLRGQTEWYDEEERMDANASEFFLSVGLLF